MTLSINSLIVRPLVIVLALLAIVASRVDAQDAELIVAKGQRFVQAVAGAPVLDSNNAPYSVLLRLATDTNGVTGVNARLPNGSTANLPGGEGGFEFQQDFATKTGVGGLDASFGSGSYQFTIMTGSGTLSPRLTLGPDAYPSTPTVTNWTALQAADSTGPIQVFWNKFSGGNGDDFVQFSVQDTDDLEVFSTPGPGVPGALTGLSNSIVIPAGTLLPGKQYYATVLFANVLALIEDPNGEGITAYFKETFLPLVTTAPPSPQGRLVFGAATFSENESQPEAAITINRVGGTTDNVSVTFATSAGTATAGSDYAESSLAVSFPSGVDSVTVRVPLFDDVFLEGPETVRLHLSGATGGADIGALSNAVLVITDNEITNAGAFSFSVPLYRTTERSRKASLMVMRSASVGQVSIDVSTMDRSAVAPGDYAATNVTLVFSNGVRSRMLSIPVFDDALDETNETFQVRLSNPTGGASMGARATADVLITDDDTAGSFSFSSTAYSVNETGSVANVTVRRLGGKALASVDFAAIADTATSPDDFVATNLNVVFGSNELQKVVAIVLNPDALPESDESFRVTLRNPVGGAKIGSISNAMVRIVDDESSVSFTNVAYTVSEAGPALSITVVRSGALATAVSVDVAMIDGTAQSPADYKGTNFTLNLGPKLRSKTISIPIQNDALDETDETFTVQLSNPQGGVQLGSIVVTTVTILDNDGGGTVQFGAANYSVSESAGNASVTLVRTGGLAANAMVHLEASTGSAAPGSDYTAVSTNVTFAAGENMKTVLIPVLIDGASESAETVNLVLSGATGGATIGPTDQATLTITDAPDPDAVPLTGTAFFNVSAVGVTNVAFSRTFNAATFVGLQSQGFNNTYVVVGNTVGLSGIEQFQITIPGLVGPERFSVMGGGPVEAVYLRNSGSTATSFGYRTSAPGAVGFVTIDGFDGTSASGHGQIIMSDETDSTKWIKATFSFRATL